MGNIEIGESMFVLWYTFVLQLSIVFVWLSKIMKFDQCYYLVCPFMFSLWP